MAETEPAPSEGVLTLMTWNVNSLPGTVRNMELRHKSFKGFLDHWNVDIACFQEVKLPEAKITKELACVNGCESFWAVSREKQGYSGVTTWVRDAWSPVSAEVDSLGGGDQDIDREGRVVITDHGSFVLINVYAPNAGDAPARPRVDYKCRFLAALKAKMDALSAAGRAVVAVGDFNIAIEPRDVHHTMKHEGMYSDRELELMSRLLACYPDVWRRLHPDATDVFTVWDEKTSARAFNAGLRLDYVLVSPSLLDHITSCEVLTDKDIPPKWSDHAALIIKLKAAAAVATSVGTGTGAGQAAGLSGGGLAPPPPHAPCALSSKKNKRFNQPSIAALLLGKGGGSGGSKRAAPAAEAPAPAAEAPAAGGSGSVKRSGSGSGGANGMMQQHEEAEGRPNKVRAVEAAAVSGDAVCGDAADAALPQPPHAELEPPTEQQQQQEDGVQGPGQPPPQQQVVHEQAQDPAAHGHGSRGDGQTISAAPAAAGGSGSAAAQGRQGVGGRGGGGGGRGGRGGRSGGGGRGAGAGGASSSSQPQQPSIKAFFGGGASK